MPKSKRSPNSETELNIKGILKSIPSKVNVLAATKHIKVEKIKIAIAAGITTLGENYIKEAAQKYPLIKDLAKIHCIGHLQKNKVKKAIQIFDMIETVDSIELAKQISKNTSKKSPFPVLIEVNIAKEPQKSGVYPDKAMELADFISKDKNLIIKGLMTMGPFIEAEKLRPYFRTAKSLFEDMKAKYSSVDTLSMGMSDSYKVAVEEGATEVRLGTILFGPRL